MATLNTHGHAHGDRSENYAGGVTIDYNSFPQNYAHLGKVRSAMRILDRLADREPPTGRCNKYFKTLGINKTFTELWNSGGLFINYSSRNVAGEYADTHSNKKDIALHEWALVNKNHWMIAATLCHETAHCAGAPGGASNNAEKAVKECYFGDQLYDPTIVGQLESAYNELRTALA